MHHALDGRSMISIPLEFKKERQRSGKEQQVKNKQKKKFAFCSSNISWSSKTWGFFGGSTKIGKQAAKEVLLSAVEAIQTIAHHAPANPAWDFFAATCQMLVTKCDDMIRCRGDEQKSC